MRGHKTCLKSLTEQRSDLRGVRETPDGRPGVGVRAHFSRKCQDRTLGEASPELGGQYPEILQESKDPRKANKKPTHPPESWWGSLVLNTQ